MLGINVADDIVPPRRNEILTRGGVGVLRFMEYLERVTDTTNSTSSDFELFSSLALNSQQIASFQKRIEDLEDRLPDNFSAIVASELNKKIEHLEVLSTLATANQLSNLLSEFKVVSTNVDYTTTGKEIVVCTNTSTKITITLRDNPNNKDEVHILKGTGSVDMISAAGINGSTTIVPIIGAYSSPHLIYVSDAGEYRII
jgi:hypothetical protein